MYLDYYIEEIKKLCKNYDVKFLFAFGSVLTKNFTKDSDIDFLVEIESKDPISYAENYFALKFRLEDLLNRPIDLLEHRGLKNSFLIKRINKTKKIIYES